VRLFGQQVERPGDGVGGGLVAGEVESRGVVDRQAERLGGLILGAQGPDEIAEEIVGAAVGQAVAHHVGQGLAEELHAALPLSQRTVVGDGGQAEHGGEAGLAAGLQRAAM
jgi:hypothetical protein